LGSGLDTIGGAVGAIVGSQAVFVCLALGLACVFVLSGVPKLRKPELAALAIVDFGVMHRASRRAGLALGAAECCLALALAVAAAADTTVVRVLPALAAALLLWGFVALIAGALRSGAEFACYCFGSDEGSLSPVTLIRTGLLATLAIVLAVASFGDATGPSVSEWIAGLLVGVSAVGSAVLLAKVPAILRVSA
jgi:hypothetical protein